MNTSVLCTILKLGTFLFPIYCRISQGELKQHLDSLSDDLKQLAEQQSCPLDLEKYVRKLNDAKAKITVVGNILQTSQVCS